MNKGRIYICLIIILCIILIVREGCYRSSSDKLVSDITSYKDSAKVEKLKNGALIYTNAALELKTQKQLITLASSINDTVKQMLKRFKSITNVTNITNTFLAGGDTVRLSNEIPCDFNPIKIRTGHDSTYHLVGTISKKSFSVDSLSIKDNQTFVFGRRKISFMKYDNVVDINHSNSLMKTSNIKNYQFTPDKKWFERTWVHIAIGATGAAIIKQVITIFIPK